MEIIHLEKRPERSCWILVRQSFRSKQFRLLALFLVCLESQTSPATYPSSSFPKDLVFLNTWRPSNSRTLDSVPQFELCRQLPLKNGQESAV